VLYSFKKQPIMPIANYDASGYVLVKEIVSLLSLQLMYSYLNESTLYAGVLYMQPSWYSFSSLPHSDITSLGCSVTCTFLALPFSTAEVFLGWDYFCWLYNIIQLSGFLLKLAWLSSVAI